MYIYICNNVPTKLCISKWGRQKHRHVFCRFGDLVSRNVESSGGRSIHLCGVCGTSAGQRWTRSGSSPEWCVLYRYWLRFPINCRCFCCLRFDETRWCNSKLWVAPDLEIFHLIWLMCHLSMKIRYQIQRSEESRCHLVLGDSGEAWVGKAEWLLKFLKMFTYNTQGLSLGILRFNKSSMFFLLDNYSRWWSRSEILWLLGRSKMW